MTHDEGRTSGSGRLSRRDVLAAGAGATTTAALAVGTSLVCNPATVSSGASILLPPPSGDNDTPAINDVIAAAAPGSTITARPGSIYQVGTPIVLYPNLRYDFGFYYNNRVVTPAGSGGAGTIFKQQKGANLNYMLATRGFTRTGAGNTMDAPVWISGLCVDGNRENQTGGAGNGLVLTSWRSVVEHSTIMQTRGNGIVITDRQADDHNLGGLGFENRIQSCTVDSAGGRGIYVARNTNLCTDGFIRDCCVGFTGLEGIRVDAATGWLITGNHVYATKLDGITTQQGYATRISDNYVEGFGNLDGSISTTWSSGATYNRWAVVTYSGVIYFSLIDGNVGNIPSSSPSSWQAQLAGTTVWGIGSYAGGYSRPIHIHDNVVSIGHQSITLQSGWNYQCYLVQGSTSGTSTYLLHDNHAANEMNASGARNTMALRASLSSGSGNLVTHHNISAVGTFGAPNSIDAAWTTAPTTF